MAARKTPVRKDQLFAVEVEPGVFVYSLPLRHELPAATRKMIDDMNAREAEGIRRDWAALSQRLAGRNGHGPGA